MNGAGNSELYAKSAITESDFQEARVLRGVVLDPDGSLPGTAWVMEHIELFEHLEVVEGGWFRDAASLAVANEALSEGGVLSVRVLAGKRRFDIARLLKADLPAWCPVMEALQYYECLQVLAGLDCPWGTSTSNQRGDFVAELASAIDPDSSPDSISRGHKIQLGRIANTLRRSGIASLEELRALAPAELREIPQLGDRGVKLLVPLLSERH